MIHDGFYTVYIYSWGNNSIRAKMKGRHCIVLARGARNSAKIKFLDSGETFIVSRYALREAI
jgi:hypothetical protein